MLLTLMISGCTSPRLERAILDRPKGSGYAPDNLYAVDRLAGDIRTVMVLPFGLETLDQPFMPEVETALVQKLHATGRFHVVHISADDLLQETGYYRYPYDGPIASDMLQLLRKRYRADAVLLTEVTAFRPYKPLVLGMRARLIRLSNYQTLWAVDELFDAGDREVTNGARLYAERHLEQAYPLQSSFTPLHSPRRFAGYVGDILYETLPAR